MLMSIRRDVEPKIMEYQTQQYKLLPLLAAAYVYTFAGKHLKSEFNRLNVEIQNGQVEALPEVTLCIDTPNN